MKRVLLLLALAPAAAGCGGSAPKTHVYGIPSSAMEPTLHCAKGPGCRAKTEDHVVVQLGASVKRGDIVVFRTPPQAALRCGEGGLFVKRVVGLPGETVHEEDRGFIDVDGKRLREPYLGRAGRLADSAHFGETWHVAAGDYFVLGDNRSQSCDSRTWGGVPQRNVVGPVVRILRNP